MTLKIPRDFLYLVECRRLKELLGDETKTIVMFMALYTHLGYEVEATGASGFMSDEDSFVFRRSLPFEVEEPLAMLETSGLIKKVPGGYECRIFTAYNANLDANYIPDETDSMWSIFINGKAQMAQGASDILNTIPPESWYGKEGRIDPAMMKRIILLIKMIDSVLKIGKRHPAEFEPPLISAGLAVITEWTDTQITVIIRRAFEVSRKKRLPTGFTRSTIVFLEKFEDIVTLLMPADGYLKWSKQIVHRDMTE